MDAPDYILSESEGVVEAWSVARLQFEAKGWQREFRAALRLATAALGRVTERVAAQYVSAIVDASCDTENVLFYNVGGGFSVCTRLGLRFERHFAPPKPPPGELSAPVLHYHRYEPADAADGFSGWRERALVARFGDVELPRLSVEKTKSAQVWLPLRRADAETFGRLDAQEPFALRLRVRAPVEAPAAAAVVKPIIDGVVSSLHDHDGSFADELGRRIGAQVGEQPEPIVELLRQNRNAPLGTRRLLHLRADRVQWAPDDARCVACELLIERDPRTTQPVLFGELVGVEPLSRSVRP